MPATVKKLRYQTSLPHRALGLIAAAMAAVTFSAMVLLPATLEAAGSDRASFCEKGRT